MNTTGRHLLIEYVGCNFDALNNVEQIRILMEQAARAAHMTIVQSCFHPFIPQGVTGVVVLEESHLSIHTWPEIGYAAVDLYTCGGGEPAKAHEVLRLGLESQAFEMLEVDRGLNPVMASGARMKCRKAGPRRVRNPVRVIRA